jgi:carboxypeptidase D
VIAADSQGNEVTGEFVIDVVSPPADTDQDGRVSDAEILAYIDLWKGGGVASEQDVAAAVELWRQSGSSSRAAHARATPSESVRTTNVPDTRTDTTAPEITARVTLADRAELDKLIDTGVIISSVYADKAVIETSQTEIQALRDAGFSVTVDDSGADTEAERGTYHTYEELTAELADLAFEYPSICRLTSIGQSVQGRELWVLRISDNPDLEENEPELKLTGSMHGDEPPGMEFLLRMATFLLENYGESDSDGIRATDLVNNTDLFFMPLMNPDGLAADSRYNANGLDLNRAFPDGAIADIGNLFSGSPLDDRNREPEVAAMMRWSTEQSFCGALGYHTGILLVCYPYGNNPEGQSVETPTPDDALFQALSHAYADANPAMAAATTPPGGVINAAAWYRAVGEMPDWCYRYLGTLELTVEISWSKSPSYLYVLQMWRNNQDAFFEWTDAIRSGLHGTVVDALDGRPVWAGIQIDGIDHTVLTDADVGDFHRPLLPGTYDITVTAPGYVSRHIGGLVVQQGDTQGDLVVEMNRQTPHAAIRTFGNQHYVPGELNPVTLTTSLDNTALPNAFILSETLPADWTYDPNSATNTDGTPLPEPRIDGSRISWIFWKNLSRPPSVHYDVLSAVPRSDDARVTGTLAWSQEQSTTLGDSLWLPAVERTVAYDLTPGWNLISVPVVPAPDEVERNLDAFTVWAWDGEQYRKATKLSPKQGYWLYVTGRESMSVRGWEEQDAQRQFTPGWNLFGALSQCPVMSHDVFEGPVWQWDGQFVPAAFLEPGRGYWVYCRENAVIGVP